MDTENKLVTVIVPVYNVEKYLNQCVNSLLIQTYGNIEVILSDDGSTDNSGKICDEYERNDNRVKVIHEINAGLSEARNRGIDIAKGDYICFVDSDDYVKNTYVEYLVSLINKYNAQMAICPLVRDCCGTIEKNNHKIKDKCMGAKETFDLIFVERRFVGIFVCNKLFEKELFKNIRFPIGRYFEDSGTTYKLIGKCTKVAYGDEYQYYYRTGREGSITKDSLNKQHKRYLDKLYLMNEMEEYLKKRPELFSGAFYNKYFGDMLNIFSSLNEEADADLYLKFKQEIASRADIIKYGKYLTYRVKIKLMIFKLSHRIYKVIF